MIIASHCTWREQWPSGYIVAYGASGPEFNASARYIILKSYFKWLKGDAKSQDTFNSTTKCAATIAHLAKHQYHPCSIHSASRQHPCSIQAPPAVTFQRKALKNVFVISLWDRFQQQLWICCPKPMAKAEKGCQGYPEEQPIVGSP